MLSNFLIGLVAVIHTYIVVLEMWLWEKPTGRRVFGTSAEFAQQSRVLAANQGLYNGFLVGGLGWGLLQGPAGHDVKVFFLTCVVIAGAFGGLTSSRKILFVQGLPAAFALTALLAGL